ncbi:MAG: hypothetical protein HY909_24390 [Deltaproteobacteria bacterium]|nr:hypothetical protein [Deltaproteobacteria bacterium]
MDDLVAHLDRWLLPDAALEALEPSARAWLEAMAEEHRAAAGAFADQDSPAPIPGPVRVSRSLPAALDAVGDAWAATRTPDAHLQALYRAWSEAWRREKLGDHPATLSQARTSGAWGDVHRWSGRATQAIALWYVHNRGQSGGVAPFLRLLPYLQGRHGDCHLVDMADCLPGLILAEWEALHGRQLGDRPSPWRPLLALWDGGVWPLLLPDGALLVWVPVRRSDAVVLDPASPWVPGASDALDAVRSLRRPTAARGSSCLPTLRGLGLGVLGLRQDARAPEVFRRDTLRLGAAPVIGPTPVPAPGEPDPYDRVP